LKHPQGPKRRNPEVHVKKKKKSLKFPGMGTSIHVPPAGSVWREMFCLQSQWFIHSFISVGVLKKEPSYKMQGKHIVTIHGDPRGQKAYIQWDVAWFPK